MPYYSAEQPQAARPLVAGDGEGEGGPAKRFLTDDQRLQLCEGERIVIRRPRVERLFAGVFSKSFSLLSLWVGGTLAILSNLRHVLSFAAVPLSWFLSASAMYFWWLAGPDDLILDIQQRTYYYRRGFLYLAPARRGTFRDIATIRLKPAGSTYYLLLTWDVPGRRPVCLGQIMTLRRTDERRRWLLDKLAL